MQIYAIQFLVLLVLSFKEIFIKKYNQNHITIIFILLFLLLSLTSGFRYAVGTDYFSYLRIFNLVGSQQSSINWVEPGFSFLVYIFRIIGVPSRGLFLIFSFILYAFLLRGLKRINYYPLTSLFIFYLIFNIGYVYNALRQGIVMAVFIYLITDIINGKTLKVIMLSIFAISIHSSGIFIIILYFLKHINIHKMKYLLLVFMCILFYIGNSFLKTIFIKILPSSLTDTIINYSNNFIESVSLINFIQRLIIILIFIFYYRNLNKNSYFRFDLLFKFYFLGFLIYSLFSFQGMLATRINMFFRILEIILFPTILDAKIKTGEKLLIASLFFLYALLIFMMELFNPDNVPFQLNFVF